jgi:hypothetical protein
MKQYYVQSEIKGIQISLRIDDYDIIVNVSFIIITSVILYLLFEDIGVSLFLLPVLLLFMDLLRKGLFQGL